MLEFFSITFVILLAVISPGPDFALIVRNALGHCTKVGVWSALGIAAGSLVHATYSVIGVTVLVAQSPVLFSVIKYLGAGYLIYLGLKGLLQRADVRQTAESQPVATLSCRRAFVQGFLCNLLNPKTMLFFLALFTLVLDVDSHWSVKWFYALEIAFIHFAWFALLAMLISHPSVRRRMQRLQRIITRLMGGFLVYFGSRIALL
jgi:RhtB (resistance to homoserine/threonine) family protein